MKLCRFFLLLPLLFLFSCGDSYYTENVYMDTDTKYYTVYSEDWLLMDIAPTPEDPNEDSNWTYFYYDFYEPALSNYILSNGMINAYLTNGSKSYISPLPFDDFYLSPNSHMWTEQVTCEFSPQNIRFIVKYNDFETGMNPADYTFMVRFMW